MLLYLAIFLLGFRFLGLTFLAGDVLSFVGDHFSHAGDPCHVMSGTTVAAGMNGFGATSMITRAQVQSRERELLGTGEAARVRLTGRAEAGAKKALAEETRAKLLAQSEGSRAKLLAEAEGKRASLLAKAEGKTQLAAAQNAHGPAAIQFLMYQAFTEQLPKVVEAAALPPSQIDKRVMIEGGSRTLGRYAAELPLIVERMAESFAAVSSIDLKHLAGNKLGATLMAEVAERSVIEPPPAAPGNGAAPTAQAAPGTSSPAVDEAIQGP